MSFQRLLQLIQNGEPVAAGTPNRPISQIHQNAMYLWDIINAASLGSTVYAREITIEPEVQEGMPLYYNVTNQRFERALAQMETDPDTGLLMPAASSQVWGICAVKHNDTLCDMLLFGYDDIDISAAVDGDVVPGLYYLSGTVPGGLVRQRPPVSVPVLQARDSGFVYVHPKFVDFLESHRHYRFELETSPAGDHVPPTPGERHEITNPDPDLPGWLPADHSVFEGLAPTGAAFGYNLEEDSQLRNAWPPLPVNQSYMEWDKGEDPDEGYEGVPLGPGGLCILDRNGIWWMSDCWGDVPWPKNLDTTAIDSISESEPGPLECPRDVNMSLVVWFTKLTFGTDAIVTSLRSIDDRIKIYCRDTTIEGGVGDLDIDLDLALMLGDNDRTGYLAVKDFDDEGKLHRGPVTSGLIAGTPNVQLASEFQTVDESENTVHHGKTTVAVVESGQRELRAQLVHLLHATEEHYPALYLGFPNQDRSQFVVRFEIPTDVPVTSTLAYRARIIGRVAGGLPPLTVEYLRVERPPDGLNTPIDVGGTYTEIDMDTTATLTDSDQAVEALSDAFSIAPGDDVYIRVTRDADDAEDGYAGEMGIMSQVGVLTIGS